MPIKIGEVLKKKPIPGWAIKIREMLKPIKINEVLKEKANAREDPIITNPPSTGATLCN